MDFDDSHLRKRHDRLDRVRDEVSPTFVFSWMCTLRSALGPQAFACFRKLQGAAIPAGQCTSVNGLAATCGTIHRAMRS